ncbi:filamentous haemagglutinin outer membrane protein, partial [Hymenobacter roseosalivarius DSM 11622]
MTADAQSKTYGGTEPSLTYKVTSGSLVSGDSFTGSLTRAPGESVGTYAITNTRTTGALTAGTNYELTYAGANLVIGARPITVTADAQSKTYGGTEPSLTYKVTSGSLVTGDSFSGALTREPGNSVGTYAITQGTFSAGTNYELTYAGANLVITAKALTASFTADNKVYDGNTSATILTHSLSGVLSADADKVSLTGGTATFATASVATGKTVTLTGAVLGGDARGNYSLNTTPAVTTTADITAKALTVAGVTADNKVYDGKTAATLTTTGATLSGVVTGETVTLTSTTAPATFATAAVANGKAVNVTGLGVSSSNYTLTQPTGLTANITAKQLTPMITASNKVYDGTTAATLSSQSLTGMVTGETAVTLVVGAKSFDNANVGTRTVTASNLSLGGTQASNYSLAINTTVSTSANITQATPTVTATGGTFIYDGEMHNGSGSATGVGTPAEVLSSVTLSYSGTSNGGVAYGPSATAPTNAGNYTVIASFAGNDNYKSASSNPVALTITPQTASPVADTYYTGSSYFWTSGTSSNTATLNLVATVKNNANFTGNITTAKVSFFVRNGTSLTPINGAQNLPVGVVNPGDLTVGTAAANVQYSISGTAATLNIAVVVTGNYKSIS